MDKAIQLGIMLADAIKDAQSETTAAFRGTITGDYVNVSGILYSYVLAVDVQTNDGSVVWCMFNSSKTGVVIVGA